MAYSEGLCPICLKKQARYKSLHQDRDQSFYQCPICGDFLISGTAEMVLPQDDSVERHLLSAFIREQNQYDRMPSISMYDVEAIRDSVSIPDGPSEAMDRLLLHLHRRTDRPDEPVTMNGDDYPLIAARDADELGWYLQHLQDEGLIDGVGDGKYRLTLPGWRRIQELRKTAPISNQAFVAMWFTEDLDPAWEDGFKPALEETGFEPLRVDRVEHAGKIDDFIIASIQRSGLVIADFTGQRGGVYFEAGFALGLAIPVIWTCRDDHVEGLHFDTRQYNHIVWAEPPDLRERLEDRIKAWAPVTRPRPPL